MMRLRTVVAGRDAGDDRLAREPEFLRLSVIVPAHNEAESVAGTVTALAETLTNERIPHEILVVDDFELGQHGRGRQ